MRAIDFGLSSMLAEEYDYSSTMWSTELGAMRRSAVDTLQGSLIILHKGVSRLPCAFALLAVLMIAAPARANLINEVESPSVGPVCASTPVPFALTCKFSANAAGLPVSARTDFVEDWDTLGFDGLTIAEHELFHAIGFSIS